MKQIFLFFAFLLLFSCSKDSVDTPPGGITGSVSDKTTGEPVATVNVSLAPGGQSTVTGSDGTFGFAELHAGEYTIAIRKEGYMPNEGKFTVQDGKQTTAHLLIERIPAVVTADRTELDFGNDASVNTLSFNIVNSSYEDLAWEVEHNCPWIKEIKPQNGTLKFGKTETIVVVIDRDLLDAGDNKTVVVVRSSNGSSQIEVKAVGVERKLPVLNTLAATEIAATTATLNGEIVESGIPSYTERGFVYNTEPMPTLENTLKQLTAPVTDSAVYSCQLEGLTIGGTYYARTYAKNNIGITYSSNEISFTTKTISPEVSIQPATDVDVVNGSAILHGSIDKAGEPAYTERGFVYASQSSPTLDDTKITVSGTGTGEFVANLSDLSLDKIFYVRTYAIHDAGIVYSDSSITVSTHAILPQVTTQEPSDVDIATGTATLHGTIVSAGSPAYTERGFVYSTTNNPTIYDNKIVENGTEMNSSFSVYTDILPKGKAIYIRAYAINRGGIVYGKEVEISLPWVELSAEIAVQKVDIGKGSWISANTMCQYSKLGGYTDWRLPTKIELEIIYTKRAEIGGFKTSGKDLDASYWTSTDYNGNGSFYWFMYFNTGRLNNVEKKASLNIRCVRSLK